MRDAVLRRLDVDPLWAILVVRRRVKWDVVAAWAVAIVICAGFWGEAVRVAASL